MRTWISERLGSAYKASVTASADPVSRADPRPILRQRARDLGFDVCRFADATEGWSAGERLESFVEAGRHGSMGWMETTLERRAHPTAMWDGAQSAIVLGLNYGPAHDPLRVGTLAAILGDIAAHLKLDREQLLRLLFD